MFGQVASNFLSSTLSSRFITYTIDFEIHPVWEDAQRVTLDSRCECPTLCPGAQAGHTGMLDGVRWSFTGEGADTFFIDAQNQYQSISAKGCAVDCGYPLTLDLDVPVDLLDTDDVDDILNNYLQGFETGIGKMLAVHLQAVGGLIAGGIGTQRSDLANVLA